MTPKHLFILCPPASGSTLLWQLLRTSPHVAAFPREGQALAKDVLFNPQRWDPGMTVDWEKVRKAWEAAWDANKPVRLEKSPPHLVRARQLEEQFPESHFIVMVRNPYASCEGVRRRWRQDLPFAAVARLWAEWAAYQADNIRRLRRVLAIRYEDLTHDPREQCRRLLEFVPELGELQVDREFSVFEKTQKIEDLNPRQIARLGAGDIRGINGVLASAAGLMARFRYEFIEADA
jgi:hypothetical protein